MKQVKVILFSGGRGSQALSKQLVSNPHVQLTLAINGYDDGLSTGEVRRFLGDCLGPSDFRKNASTVARELGSCSASLIDLLDLRFPLDYGQTEALVSFGIINGNKPPSGSGSDFNNELVRLLSELEPDPRTTLIARLDNFQQELDRTKFPFDFSDCSIGNLVFAGCYLEVGRDFNRTIDDYCALMNVPSRTVVNVTDGSNAFLVAVDSNKRLLASEADIVDANRRNYIEELFLVGQAPNEWTKDVEAKTDWHQVLAARSVPVAPNPDLLQRLEQADVIVYSPGTQHSSLFPSYMTLGLGQHIAKNLRAVKILVTNIQEDAEIPDVSAIEIIKRALYYLRERNSRSIPAPFLITHYLLNDPNRAEQGVPYVPLGRLQNIEDPRLVRIANFEEGDTGRHNAKKVLAPFIESFIEKDKKTSVAIVLLDTQSLDKVSQTVLESSRAGLGQIAIEPTFYFRSPDNLNAEISRVIPFRFQNLWQQNRDTDDLFLSAIRSGGHDFAILFESSGMYRGEDIVNLASLLAGGRLDVVWGSRRLSVRDIRESYGLRYRRSRMLGAISYIGSYLLSLTYLFLFGRYISDTLSGVRAIRVQYLEDDSVHIDDKRLNQNLLSRVLRDQGEIFETPVKFFPLSPDKANRTTAGDGIACILEVIKWRFHSQ